MKLIPMILKLLDQGNLNLNRFRRNLLGLRKMKKVMALTMKNLLLFLIIPINHSLMLTMDIPIPVTMMGREIMTQNHRIATLRRKRQQE